MWILYYKKISTCYKMHLKFIGDHSLSQISSHISGDFQMEHAGAELNWSTYQREYSSGHRLRPDDTAVRDGLRRAALISADPYPY